MTAPTQEQGWEQGWAGHQAAQMRRLARLPLSDKLQWLEEAQQIAMHLARSRQKRSTESAR
jgi:hypothetical protein